MTSMVASWGIYSKPSGGIGGAVAKPPTPPSPELTPVLPEPSSFVDEVTSPLVADDGTTPPLSGINPPLYAAARGSAFGSTNDLLDLNDIFSDDFLLSDQGLNSTFEDDQGGIMLGEQELDILPGTVKVSGKKHGRAQRSMSPVSQPEDPPSHDDDDDEYSRDAGQSRRRKKAKLTLKPLTEAQRVERRERNREHAKRSRMRKKFMLESLQAQMMALRKENLKLRQAVTMKMPEKADAILRTCNASQQTVAALSNVELGHHRALQDSDGKLIKCLQFSQQNFTVSDPSLPDNPIVYASEGFLKLTGYTSDQVLGRNCRFLQGPGTDPDAVDIIRRAIAAGEDASVCLLNYRADGTPFWNQFFVAALRDERGNLVNYVGVQCEVAEGSMENELKERVKSLNWDEEN